MTGSLPVLPYLDDGILGPDPIKHFLEWYYIAQAANLKLPDSAALATSTKRGRPSVRMVLLKEIGSDGIVFYTNSASRKGKELSENPYGAIVVHWAALDRSVRAEGAVEELGAERSDTYFSTRPRESQLSSWTSQQSMVVSSRSELDRRYEEMKHRFEGKKIPRPDNWGGYILKPDRIEFWQQRGEARLNDRILYEKQPNGSWRISRLAP